MKKRNIFWGIICLALAALIILSVTGVFSIPFFAGISTGKFIVTIIMIIIIVSSLSNFSIEPVIIGLGVLLKLYEKELGISISIPILIAVIFLLIMAYHFLFPHRINHNPNQNHEHHDHNSNFGEQQFKTNVTEENGDFIEIRNNFNGITKYINSQNFCGGSVDSAFGGSEIYFTNAKVPSGHATLDLNVKFGGVSIYIPYNWKITSHVSAVMGAVNESPMVLKDGETYPVELELTGSVSFSGVDVKRI